MVSVCSSVFTVNLRISETWNCSNRNPKPGNPKPNNLPIFSLRSSVFPSLVVSNFLRNLNWIGASHFDAVDIVLGIYFYQSYHTLSPSTSTKPSSSLSSTFSKHKKKMNNINVESVKVPKISELPDSTPAIPTSINRSCRGDYSLNSTFQNIDGSTH